MSFYLLSLFVNLYIKYKTKIKCIGIPSSSNIYVQGDIVLIKHNNMFHYQHTN